MSKVNDSALYQNDNAANGDVVDQTAWNQNMQVFKAAINDNQSQINNITASPTYSANPNSNLLFNPTGALGFAGWAQQNGTWTVAYDNTGAHFKSPTVNNSGSYTILSSSNIPFYANQDFTISGLVFTAGITSGDCYFEVDFYDVSGTHLGTRYGTQITAGSGWEPYSTTNTSYANTSYAVVKFVLDTTMVGYASFSRFKFEEGSTETFFTDDNTLNVVEYGGISGGPMTTGDKDVRSAFSALNNASQSLPAMTNTKVLFQTTEWDNKSEYSTSNSRFTTAGGGLYSVTIGIGLDSVTANGYTTAMVYKNGALYKRTYEGTDISGNTVTMSGSIHMKLNAGDYIEVYAYAAAARNIQSTASRTFFQVHQIG